MNSTSSIPATGTPAAAPPPHFAAADRNGVAPQAETVGAEDPAAAGPDASYVIPVIAEQLKVTRRTVETGRATRVRKVVREHRQELELPTVHEDVRVERVPVGRLVDGPLESWEEDGVLVIPVVEERLVVRTEHVLREEIRISRHRRIETAVRAVTLRGEVAIVERLDPATGDWTAIEALPAVRNDLAAAPRALDEAPERSPFDDPMTTNPGPTPQGA